jgi:DTW domain-containing protein YfiP
MPSDPVPAATVDLNRGRLMCGTCLRPQRACICRWIARTDNIVEVLILQHPLETGEAKGSARLLDLSLAHSSIAIGEIFDAQELHRLLYPSAASGEPARQPILLYPADADDTPPSRDLPDDPSALRLVVLDGTWRKTAKMLHLNPELRSLPRLPLKDPPASHYLIRKARRPDQLSTLEAACRALIQLENEAPRYAPLLDAFDGFIAQQQAWIPIAQRRNAG